MRPNFPPRSRASNVSNTPRTRSSVISRSVRCTWCHETPFGTRSKSIWSLLYQIRGKFPFNRVNLRPSVPRNSSNLNCFVTDGRVKISKFIALRLQGTRIKLSKVTLENWIRKGTINEESNIVRNVLPEGFLLCKFSNLSAIFLRIIFSYMYR